MEKELEVCRIMKFLVTGVDGFVGKHLAEVFLDKGCDVYGLTRRSEHEESDITYLFEDINDKKGILDLFKEHSFDGVFHLAGLTHPPTSFKEPVQYFETNALGSINICDAIQKTNKECVLMQCSTPEVYGICPSDKEIDETFPLRPMNPYGVSKAAPDLYILERTRNDEINAFITRSGSHTGPGRPSNYSISSDAIQIAKILKGQQEPTLYVGNLSSQRAVLDVRDIADAYYRLMLSYIDGNIPNGEIFHISGKNLQEIGYYLDIMLDAYGLEVEKVKDSRLYRKIDIPIQILNSDKLTKYIDWTPNIPIEDTLRDLVEYWRERI